MQVVPAGHPAAITDHRIGAELGRWLAKIPSLGTVGPHYRGHRNHQQDQPLHAHDATTSGIVLAHWRTYP